MRTNGAARKRPTGRAVGNPVSGRDRVQPSCGSAVGPERAQAVIRLAGRREIPQPSANVAESLPCAGVIRVGGYRCLQNRRNPFLDLWRHTQGAELLESIPSHRQQSCSHLALLRERAPNSPNQKGVVA